MPMTNAAVLGRLSAEETAALERAMDRCCAEQDTLIRQIGMIYLRGLCDMLRVQGRITLEEARQLMEQDRA